MHDPAPSVPVMVLHIEGAAGELALRRLLAGPADGRTSLLAQESVFTINPSYYPRPSPGALQGVVPIAQLTTNRFFLLVWADDPIAAGPATYFFEPPARDIRGGARGDAREICSYPCNPANSTRLLTDRAELRAQPRGPPSAVRSGRRRVYYLRY